MRGMSAGGNDAFAYCNKKTPPLGLATHIRA
jgi:hypothetical protein